MIIERQLSNIEKNFREKKIQSAFQLISDLKNKYSKNQRLDQFFNQNKMKYIKKMKVDPNQIQDLYKEKSFNDLKVYVGTLLKLDPTNAYVNSYLGEFYGKQKNFQKAQTYQEKAILSNPYDIIFYINLANTYKFLGKFSLSKLFLEYALLIDEKNEFALISYARILFILKNYHKVFLTFEKLISVTSNSYNFKYKVEFFERLIDLEKINEAKKILSKIDVEKKNEDSIKVLYLQGILKKAQNNYNEAKIIFQKCLEIDKKFEHAYIALASIYKVQNNFNACINLLNQVIRIDSNNSRAMLELGTIYSHLGEVNKGISLLKKSLEIDPFNRETKFNLGQMQIYNKEFEEGWINYKSRWFYHNFKSKMFKSQKKLLSNLNELKNVFIWAEQGIGDQIMYGSILPEISKLSKKVTVKLDKRLIKIFERKHKNINFIDYNAEINEEEYNAHLPLGDLGYFFRKDEESFNKVNFPYIDVNEKICSKVKSTYYEQNKTIVGISWTSKNQEVGKDKSIRLTDLMPILNLKNLTLLDLEYNDSEKEKSNLYKNSGLKIHRFKDLDYFNDILGVSSIINSCDVIITCSNVNAHISGALGKKTFLLLPIGKGRLLNWSSKKNHSLWYPSIKIFQQTIPGDWSGPIIKIKKEILKCQNY